MTYGPDGTTPVAEDEYTDFVNNDADWNKADFVDATWGLCTYNDHIYSIPYSMSTTFMVYRPDLLAEAGWDHFPANTEELLQCAMDCTKLDDAGNIVQMGLVPDYYWLDTILWPAAFGGTVTAIPLPFASSKWPFRSKLPTGKISR